MDCGQIQALFTAYRDQELDQRNLLLIENHLAACPRCNQEWHDFETLVERLAALPLLPAPPDLRSGIHAKLGNQRLLLPRLEQILARLLPSPFPLATAGSVLMAILLITYIAGPGFAPDPTGVPASEGRPESQHASRTRAPLNGWHAGFPAESDGRDIDLLARLPFHPSILRVRHTEAPPRGSHLYDHPLAFRVQGHTAADQPARHSAVSDQHHLHPSASRHQAAPPLMPDVTIRISHLPPGGLDFLHRQIQEEGHWQTRCYYQDYLIILVDSGELESLYRLLRRHRLPFSLQAGSGIDPSSQKKLLVAIRP